MEKKETTQNPLLKGIKTLHKKMQKGLKADAGECFFGVMQQGDELTTAFFGDIDALGEVLIKAVTNTEDLAQSIIASAQETPGYAEFIASLALKLDPSKLNLNKEEKKTVANALREVANNISKE